MGIKKLFLNLFVAFVILKSDVFGTKITYKGAKINAFTNQPDEGNPAGVIYTTTELDKDVMSAHAKKIKQSETKNVMSALAKKIKQPEITETAFVSPRGKEENTFNVRWLTLSGEEVMLCGHATLAAMYYLQSIGKIPVDTRITFHTQQKGELYAKITNENKVELDLPSEKPDKNQPLKCMEVEGVYKQNLELTEKEIKNEICKALNLKCAKIKFISKTATECFIQVENPQDVINVKPNFEFLKRIRGKKEEWKDFEGFIVTAPYKETTSEGYDFISRVFCPRVGILEDHVTGSAHVLLTTYYYHKFTALRRSGRKDELTGYQASKRKGVVKCIYDDNTGRVKLRGDAYKVDDLNIPL